MSCTTTPEAVLSKGCWDLSQTRNLFFSTRKYSVNEPLESGSIVNDLAEFDTWQDFLESGKMLMLRVTVGEDTSTGPITGEVGGRQEVLGQGEARYSFNVETGCPYTQQLETFKGFSGGYLYYMNEGKSVGGILSDTSGEVEPIKLNKVAAIAPKGINNGADINSIMIHVYFDAAQMFDMCVYKTNFRYTALNQRAILEGWTKTASSGLLLGELAFSDDAVSYSGTTGDGCVTAIVDGVEVSVVYVVDVSAKSLQVAIPTTEDTEYNVKIDGDCDFWDTYYFGITAAGIF